MPDNINSIIRITANVVGAKGVKTLTDRIIKFQQAASKTGGAVNKLRFDVTSVDGLADGLLNVNTVLKATSVSAKSVEKQFKDISKPTKTVKEVDIKQTEMDFGTEWPLEPSQLRAMESAVQTSLERQQKLQQTARHSMEVAERNWVENFKSIKATELKTLSQYADKLFASQSASNENIRKSTSESALAYYRQQAMMDKTFSENISETQKYANDLFKSTSLSTDNIRKATGKSAVGFYEQRASIIAEQQKTLAETKKYADQLFAQQQASAANIQKATGETAVSYYTKQAQPQKVVSFDQSGWKKSGGGFLNLFKSVNISSQTFRDNLSKTVGGVSKLGASKNMFQRWSWSFTMLAMSSLGIYFSMYGLINMLRSGVTALLAPILDLNSAFEGLAMAQAFGGETGQELNDTFESMGGSDALVGLWMDLQGAIGNVKTAILILAMEVLPQLIPKIEEVTAVLVDKISDPAFIDAVVNIINAFLDMVPAILSIIPVVANLIKWLSDSGLLGVFVKLMAITLLAMPIFSVLSALFAGLGLVVQIASGIMGLFGISIGEAGVAGLLSTLLGRVTFLFGPFGILIGLVLAIITYFGWWDDIIRVVGKAFIWFSEVLRPVLDLLNAIGQALSGFGDWLGRIIFGEEYTPANQVNIATTSASSISGYNGQLPTTTQNNITYNISDTMIGNEEMLDELTKHLTTKSNYSVTL